MPWPTGRWRENPVLRGGVRRARAGGGRVHLLGLVSDGGVHSLLGHLGADRPAREGARGGRPRVHRRARHPPTAAAGLLAELEVARAAGRIGSVIGRYYAMDRDGRWDRVSWPTTCSSTAERRHRGAAAEAARAPTRGGRPTSSSRRRSFGEARADRPGDSVICFNFRPDRMRELTRALAEPKLPSSTGRRAARRPLTTMTEYEAGWPFPVAFTPAVPRRRSAATIAGAGGRQLHVAETEKYAARDVLLQRRARGRRFDGEDASSGRLAARRRDLRPQARDERRGGGRRVVEDVAAEDATTSA